MASMNFLVFAILVVAVYETSGRPGGLSPVKAADRVVKEITISVKADVEAELGLTFDKFKAISYRSQVVTGTMYFVKVKVAHNDYLHLKVFKPLFGGRVPRLLGIQSNKSKDDRILRF